MKTLKFLIIIFLLFATKSKAEKPFWELVSIGPPWGHVRNFAFNDSNDIFASSYNGVFKSTDNGDSWRLVLPGRPVMSVVVCENGTLLARQAFGINRDSNYGSYTILRSFDNGESWEEIEKFWKNIPDSFSSFRNPYILLGDKNNILLGIYCSSKYEYYNSTNFGDTWKKCGEIEADGTLYINYFTECFFKDSLIIQFGVGVFGEPHESKSLLEISNDFGKSWKKYQMEPIYLKDLYFKSQNEFYLASSDGIYFSSDQGQSWVKKWLSGIMLYHISMQGEDTIIASALDRIYYSYNKGISWQTAMTDMVTSKMYDREVAWTIDIDKHGRIFTSAGDNGIYISEDMSQTWEEKNNGFSALGANDIIFQNNGKALISNRGVFESDNELKEWRFLGLKGYNLGLIAVNSKGYIFTTDLLTFHNKSLGIFRSTDQGKSWLNFKNGFMYTYATICSKHDILLTSSGIDVASFSTDDGETWQYSPNKQEKIGTNDEGDLFTLGWDEYSTKNDFMARSTNNGKSWDSVGGGGFGLATDLETLGIPGRTVFNNRTKTAWYGPKSNYNYTFRGIFRTTDNGRNWVPENNISGPPYNEWWPDGGYDVAVDSLGCWIAKRNDYGIYRSCDNAQTWELMDTTGFRNKIFGPIAVSPDGYIYVFGYWGGLYRSRDRFVSVEEEKSRQTSDEIICNPNPVHDYLEITKPSEGSSNVVKIFNVFGEIVQNPTPTLPEGEGVRIDVSGLPSGVYFVRVGDKVGKFVKI